MSDEDDLRKIVITILRSRGCQDIAFKNAGVSAFPSWVTATAT